MSEKGEQAVFGRVDWDAFRKPLDTVRRWYAVYDTDCSGDGDGCNCWTVSPDGDKLGWETDCGCEGYGLPREVAEWIVGVLNNRGNPPA